MLLHHFHKPVARLTRNLKALRELRWAQCAAWEKSDPIGLKTPWANILPLRQHHLWGVELSLPMVLSVT